MTDRYDIIVVGAGLVGCVLALALAKYTDYSVLVIEPGTALAEGKDNTFDSKVLALSNQSAKLLQDLGVWDSICSQRYCAYQQMQVWDGDGTANIHFDSHDIRRSQLGFIVENAIILRALREALVRTDQIRLLAGARLESFCGSNSTPNRVEKVVVQTTSGAPVEINCRLLFAADGAHSKVRALAGINTREWDYEQSAIVATVQTECSHEYTAWQRFTTDGPVAFLPLSDTRGFGGDTHHCSLVWSAKSELAANLIKQSDAKFRLALGRAFEYRLGAVQSVSERFCVPLRQCFATSYIRPGLALFGDAAHTIHPLAGQGVNLGLYDVIAMRDEIVRADRRGVALWDYATLQRYERKRQAHNLLAMATMETFKRLFASETPIIRWLRNVGLDHCDRNDWLKKKLIEAASGG